ncbi:HEAT repeat domain-containing protein [Saccharibacillus sacchari]|uniref:HEAT repeat domain-containing protein n=1 Tax=Saccharibacillus sacchari TaxID=456493 RepID=A0ACC6PD84_9BACL
MIDMTILRIVWAISAVLILLMLLMLFYLIERKVRRTQHRANVAEAVALLEGKDSPLGHYLASGERSRSLTASATGLRREALEEALLDRLAISASEVERQRVYELAADYFSEEYTELLSRRRWSERMNTLLHIEKFRIRRLKEPIIERLDVLGDRPDTDDERFLLVRTLASLQLEEMFDYFAIAEHRFSELQLMQLLRPVRGELLDRLVRDFDRLPPRIAHCVLDTLRLGNIRTTEVLELLERCLRSEDTEMRIRALKALANFGYMNEETADLLEERMQLGDSIAWPERLMQARLAGVVREDRFAPYLEKMMADPAYEVRREAGASLSKYRDGMDRIRLMTEEHTDRFARDMALETLERRAYERHVG